MIILERKFKVRINGTELDLEETDQGLKVEGILFRPRIVFTGKFYKVFVGEQEFKIEHKEEGIFLNGKEIDFDFSPSPPLLAKKGLISLKGTEVKAAIPGKIVEIKVTVGEEVKDQQCLLVLESMKMRNEILSPIEGVVESIMVNEGDQVMGKQLLLKIRAKTPAEIQEKES